MLGIIQTKCNNFVVCLYYSKRSQKRFYSVTTTGKVSACNRLNLKANLFYFIYNVNYFPIFLLRSTIDQK